MVSIEPPSEAFLEAEREARQRLEVLELPEWHQPMSNSSGSCPWCENMEHWGHAEGCPRALVLEILRTALS